MSLIFFESSEGGGSGYKSIYNFDLKYEIKLHFSLSVEISQKTETKLVGYSLIGAKSIELIPSTYISCSGDCVDKFYFKSKTEPYIELSNFIFIKNSIFRLEMIYVFSNTFKGLLEQKGILPYSEDNIGEIILTPSLPIILPIAQSTIEFTTSKQDTILNLELKSEYFPQLPIDNFIYKVNFTDKTNFVIKEDCFAIIKATFVVSVSGTKTITGFYNINYTINNLEINIDSEQLIDSSGTTINIEKLIKLSKDDQLYIYTSLNVTPASLDVVCKQTISDISFTIV
jgi:hypothetical protein